MKMVYVFHAFVWMILFCHAGVNSQQSKAKRSDKVTDCGMRQVWRDTQIDDFLQTRHHHARGNNPRNRMPKIISGSPTKDGQFPWQASLELLHPSMGFLGHWCGGVLIHKYWILSAAHCVHNDLFNLPLPPLWTVVLGEHNRDHESGNEQRIPVEKIILHRHYENFRHDLVLMKLSMSADLSESSNIGLICLPFIFNEQTPTPETYDVTTQTTQEDAELDFKGEDNIDLDGFDTIDGALSEKMDNFLRSVQSMHNLRNPNPITSMKELMDIKISNRLQKVQPLRSGRGIVRARRRNDKLMRTYSYAEDVHDSHKAAKGYEELPYLECVATGWGKSNITGDLTNTLLRTTVPLHNIERCRDAYGGFVKIHGGHLCAGKLNGKGGTCVGDSGGPLQCRLTSNGPWILAGITSFGSGCAVEGFPDVYTRISFYTKWIQDTITSH